ncbi:MAG TPA: energy transducer TonB, partial [Sphingomicrobium sp.]|nr:energy transducer TonB [Sphingomicrobium sp.]
MSYAQRKEMSSNRTVAIIIVALIHLILGYAIVTGLAYNVIKKAAEDLKTFDVEEEPPPPE